MKRKYGFLLTAVAALVVMALGVCFTNTGAVAAGGTTVTANWSKTAEAESTMTLSGISGRGVGRAEYSKIPATTQIYQEQSQNAFIIDISDYSTLNTSFSVKYKTNIPDINSILIYLHHGAGTVKGVATPAGVTLVAFFGGWNTGGYVAKDGVAYRTVNSFQSEYVGDCPVTAIQFSLESSDTAREVSPAHYLELLGVEFHLASEKPSFVTDPVDPAIGTIVNDAANTPANFFTLGTTASGTRVTYTGASDNKLSVPVTDWTPVFRSLAITVVPRAGMKFVVMADSTVLTDYNFDDSVITTSAETVLYYDIPDSIQAISALKICLDPLDAGYTPNEGQTVMTVKRIDFNNSFALEAPVIAGALSPVKGDDGAYTLSVTGQAWNAFTVPVSGWNPTYDMFTIKLATPANTLFAVRLLDSLGAEMGYLRNHYKADALFTTGGEKTLVYFNVAEIAEARTLSAIELYIDAPTGMNPAEDEGTKTVVIHSYALKRSALMPSATVTATDLTVDYDGEPHAVTGTSDPVGEMKTYYKLAGAADSTFTDAVPVRGGTYIARVTFVGNETYRISYKDVTLIINRVAAPAPDEDILVFNYVTAQLDFTSAVEVCADTEFETLIAAGTAFTEGAVYYARNKETTDYFASASISKTAPVRSDIVLSGEDKSFAYDGTAKTLTGASVPAGLQLVYLYKPVDAVDTAYTDAPPIDAGVYTVKITFEGTEQYRTASITKTLTITRSKAPLPTLDAITINFTTERISFDSGKYSVSATAAFAPSDLYGTNATIVPGATLYIKRLEDNNLTESDAAAVTLPARSVAAPNVAIDFKEETTTIDIGPDMQVKMGNEGWVSGVGGKMKLLDGTEYLFRVKATATAFAGNSTTLTVPARPSKPVAVSADTATKNSVTLVQVSGYEYKCRADGEWQDSNVFTDLESNTEYEFFARKKATDSAYASLEVSAFLSTTGGKGGCNGTLYGSAGITLFCTTLLASVFVLLVGKKRTQTPKKEGERK